jgi:hypothetical protein
MVMISRWRVDQKKTSVPPSKDRVSTRTVQDESTALPSSIPLHKVFTNRLISLLVENNLPTSNSVYLALGNRHNWVLHINNLPSLTPAFEDALLAVTAARLGRHSSSPELVHESLRFYTRSMSRVRADILDTSKWNYEQTLATCLALITYEVVECPGGTFDGYQAHYKGCMDLLQRQGADAHRFGLARSTFQVLRIHTVRGRLCSYC